jgi:hypothetical protein
LRRLFRLLSLPCRVASEEGGVSIVTVGYLCVEEWSVTAGTGSGVAETAGTRASRREVTETALASD